MASMLDGLTAHEALIDELAGQVELGVKDALPEHPDLSEDDVYHAIWDSVTHGQPEAIRRGVARAVGL